ncbi:MAG: hypothetical protein IJ062_02605 [Firmicutes bacterium]|nr:hypothetical protein [Bacillota bacterium]
MPAKDLLSADGFEVVKNIYVRCKNCGGLHIFRKGESSPDTWSEEANMGTRTEYTFLFDGQCKRCGNRLLSTVRVSEYPPGTMEGEPSIECEGCEEIEFSSNSVEYCDYGTYINSPEISHIIIQHPQQVGQKLSFVLDDGQAIVDEDERPYHNGHITIEVPFKRQLADILLEETGTIRFDGNDAVLSEIIDGKNSRNTAMKILGKVAEAVIVRNCFNNPEINKKWLDKARRGKSKPEIASRFRAIGTGLHSTKREYPHKYNPFDTQRDVIWMDSEGKVANVIGSNVVSGVQAGLQIKVSGNGANYVQRAMIKNQYEVPVVYFPINDDFDQIVSNLRKKAASGEISPIEIGADFIDVREVDKSAFNSVYDYYPILEDLFYGRISANDFVKEAYGIVPLQNAILANALEGVAKRILLFK